MRHLRELRIRTNPKPLKKSKKKKARKKARARSKRASARKHYYKVQGCTGRNELVYLHKGSKFSGAFKGAEVFHSVAHASQAIRDHRQAAARKRLRWMQPVPA